MKTAHLLKEMIDHLSDFEKENPQLGSYTMEDFLLYLHHKTSKQNVLHEKTIITPDDKPNPHDAILLSRLISLLYRYAKNYSRKALGDSPIQTIKEFSFLIVLFADGSKTKSELIQENVMEITSGMEVIKRLLKKEFIKQYRDQEDKRSMRVEITNKGTNELHKVIPRMQMATAIIKGNLSTQEQKSLIFLLEKLEHYHEQLDMTDKNESLDSIFKKVKNNQPAQPA